MLLCNTGPKSVPNMLVTPLCASSFLLKRHVQWHKSNRKDKILKGISRSSCRFGSTCTLQHLQSGEQSALNLRVQSSVQAFLSVIIIIIKFRNLPSTIPLYWRGPSHRLKYCNPLALPPERVQCTKRSDSSYVYCSQSCRLGRTRLLYF
jgi:hypothetical protein